MSVLKCQTHAELGTPLNWGRQAGACCIYVLPWEGNLRKKVKYKVGPLFQGKLTLYPGYWPVVVFQTGTCLKNKNCDHCKNMQICQFANVLIWKQNKLLGHISGLQCM